MAVLEVAAGIILGLVGTAVLFVLVMWLLSEMIYWSWARKNKKRVRYDG
jgi:hypothetical protein